VDKILEDFFPHKQMSEHTKIRNTEIYMEKAGKTMEEREFTLQ